MKAVILCGGLGTRLRPITYEIPKVLIPVKGKPVLEHLFDLFRREGITDVTLAVGYLRDRIKKQVGSVVDGTNVSYIEESSPLGTAGPLRLLDAPQEPFVVSNGDELKDIPIRDMLDFHKKHDALVTIALTRVENPSAYGVARMDGERIAEFLEKPLNPPSNLISAGFYIIDPRVLSRIPSGYAMLEKDVFPVVAEQGKLYGYVFSGQWFDTGNFERYEKAIMNWKGIDK